MLKKGHYLQIAFNRPLSEVKGMVEALPLSEKIIIEAGTPLIKKYGAKGISSLKNWRDLKTGSENYIVADLKCMDRGLREVEIAAGAGAGAATCLGLAPTETIDEFIKNCEELGIDSMIDMMNIPFPFEILQKLKKRPKAVVLHRGADENEKNKEKQIPYRQVHQIKGAYNILISIAGAENFKEVRRAIFNDADIAVVWRSFYESPEKTAKLAEEFLRETR